MARKKYTFVLNFGYAEQSYVSFMPWTSSSAYTDAKIALADLAEFLREQYLKEHQASTKKCCAKAKEKDSEAEFCPRCGRRLADAEFESEYFEDWLRQMGSTDMDGFHGGHVEWDEDHRWRSDGLEGKPNQRFVYQAEWVLSAALGHPHHLDRTFETICQERTKSKRESFSYY